MELPLHLILGGSGSGKSRHAEAVALARNLPVTYLATYAAIASDAEMEERLNRHRRRRPSHWITVENRFDLKEIFRERRDSLILLDCLTLWLSYRQMSNHSEESILAELEEALRSIDPGSPGLIVVSDEVGMGLIPATAEGRKFRDLVGRANQLVAGLAPRVEFVAAGLPLTLKGKGASS